jgi:hypothetical protein
MRKRPVKRAARPALPAAELEAKIMSVLRGRPACSGVRGTSIFYVETGGSEPNWFAYPISSLCLPSDKSVEPLTCCRTSQELSPRRNMARGGKTGAQMAARRERQPQRPTELSGIALLRTSSARFSVRQSSPPRARRCLSDPVASTQGFFPHTIIPPQSARVSLANASHVPRVGAKCVPHSLARSSARPTTSLPTMPTKRKGPGC